MLSKLCKKKIKGNIGGIDMKIQTITEDCIRDHDKFGYYVPDSLNMTFNPSVKVVKWQKKRGK